MTDTVIPFALKDAPALIEKLLPVQKLSVEAYKEQMAVQGKTLTALGSYWKGRKPLILNKACILGCLLPATSNATRDLEIFERLMAMDEESFVARWKRQKRPKEILATLQIDRIADLFVLEPEGILPTSAPIDFSVPTYDSVRIEWRNDIPALDRRRLESQLLPRSPYRDWVDQARRPEEVIDTVHDHIWDEVNLHLGTKASSIAQLTQQLGIMRFGHRPRVGDTFCGSGQIAFEAARIGCDVNASDLNPIACMLTWGAFNIVAGSAKDADILARHQLEVKKRAQAAIDDLGIEADGNGWRAKVFLYCVEARCPQSGWLVPMLPSRVVSTSRCAIAELVADPVNRRYEIRIDRGVSPERMMAAELGTIVRDEKFGEGQLIHTVGDVKYKTKISTLRGDYLMPNGDIENQLRRWGKEDFVPLPDDLLQERLYAVQWMRTDPATGKEEYEFRSTAVRLEVE